MLASHHLEAIAADPEADDVPELRASAREALAAAGRAAASLALGPEALRYFEQAAELAEDDDERAELFEQAGRALWQSGDGEAAEERLRTAIELYAQSGRPGGGPAALGLGMLLRLSGRAEAARPVLERFLAADDAAVDRVARADALAELGSVHVQMGSLEEAGPLLEEALAILEDEQAWPQLALALVSLAVWLAWRSRREESFALLRHALRLAEQHDLPHVALRARYNLAGLAIDGNQLAEAVDEVNAGLLVARERGDRVNELQLLGQAVAPMTALGDWDQAASAAETVLAGSPDRMVGLIGAFLAQIAAARGDDATLERCVTLGHELRESEDVDVRTSAVLIRARAALERGAADDALQLAREALESESNTGELAWEAYAVGVEAALERGDEGAMAWLGALVDGLPPVQAMPLLRAGRACSPPSRPTAVASSTRPTPTTGEPSTSCARSTHARCSPGPCSSAPPARGPRSPRRGARHLLRDGRDPLAGPDR